MKVREFSKKYETRKMSSEDVDEIYNLSLTNPLYYDYCPPPPTKESILEDLSALPPNVTIENKYIVGFFEKGRMIAVMDLIDGYPEEKIAFIGFFMTHASVQNKGLGSAIISEVMDYLKSINYLAVRLAWAKGNPQAEHFWLKNGFFAIKETSSTAADHVILAERKL
jgi:Acetyltransferase (GNAT) family.